MTQTPYFTALPGRGLVKITGEDRRAFLQGLISNDINLLDSQPCVYACLLNPQGKFLYDFFITEEDGALLLDCEGGERAQSLSKKLSLYKLHAKIEIACDPAVKIYASNQKIGHADPRHPGMGYRSLEKPNLPEQPFETWDYHRITLTVPDGSRDMIVDKSTLDESGIDQLNGVSYEKGCYMGQELTARMHYRGLGKKHLRTVKLPLDESLDAELRSSCGDIGIALLKG